MTETVSNIVLIGMPWSGKSTIGILLAKQLSRNFVDTDVVIQSAEGCRLQKLIDHGGAEAFRKLEEKHVLTLNCRGYIIATGGSVVYSHQAMEHLKKDGICVYLSIPLEVLLGRATQMDMRGLVREPGQGLESLYEQRRPLYEQYADITIECGAADHETVLTMLLEALKG